MILNRHPLSFINDHSEHTIHFVIVLPFRPTGTTGHDTEGGVSIVIKPSHGRDLDVAPGSQPWHGLTLTVMASHCQIKPADAKALCLFSPLCNSAFQTHMVTDKVCQRVGEGDSEGNVFTMLLAQAMRWPLHLTFLMFPSPSCRTQDFHLFIQDRSYSSS